MPKIAYESLNMSEKTLKVIALANDIIHTYAAQGYDLTLRQLYYQFVSRDLLANKQTEYKRLGDIVSKGRRAGLIDWNAIVDRTRNLKSLGAWDSPSDIIAASASQFRYDWWAKQSVYVEVWFEKDALMGVFERAANKYRVPFFSCRGYTSDSEVWSAAQRMASKARRGKQTVVLHFGDHDPSGIDMTRDIGDRLRLFGAGRVDVRRLALNMDQIEQYDPPPNPAKETDSRFVEYQALHGDESWELDALEPTVLGALVRDEVNTLVEQDAWDAERLREAQARAELQEISDNYDSIAMEYPPSDVTLDDLEDDDEEA
jgi:hypothetical protein